MRCLVCGRRAPWGLRTSDKATVCRACSKKTPQQFEARIGEMTSPEVRAMVAWCSERCGELSAQFRETCRCGEASLDASTGALAIGDTDRSGRLEKWADVFDLRCLSKISPSMEVVSQSRGEVEVSVKVELLFDHPVRYRVSADLGKGAAFGEEEEGFVRFSLPYATRMFLDEVAAAASACETEGPSVERMAADSEEREREAEARGLFLLGRRSFTARELKKRRNELMKALHPDNGGPAEYAAAISDGYELLSKLAKKEGP